MKKWRLWLLAFFTMFVAVGLAVVITIFDGGYWSFIPMIAWLVLGQIFIVPKILGRNYRWGLFLFMMAMMALSFGAMLVIAHFGGGWFAYLPPLIWVAWSSLYVMPRIKASEEK
ncbi:hypothetical protein ACFOOP_09455 [Marinicaulis aureus]|uniref:Uncharacterized protein n=1 Tax=Hyphococcus aureus TaxID=2666033 RepID=A0ABW1KSS9_9PROT